MRRQVKRWSAILLVLVSLWMPSRVEHATLLQQPLPHHPPHHSGLIHTEMAVTTVTSDNDWCRSKTSIQSSPHLVAPVIDGAGTWGRIPNEVALRIVFETKRCRRHRGAEELARVNGKLARLGLEEKDLQGLTEEFRACYTASAERKERVANIRRSFNPITWSSAEKLTRSSTPERGGRVRGNIVGLFHPR